MGNKILRLNDIARNASQAKNPCLWQGLRGAWYASLGIQGSKLLDVSGRDGTNIVNNFNWAIGRRGPVLERTGTNNQEIEFPTSYTPLDGLTSFTVRVVCKPITVTTDLGIFFTEELGLNVPIALWFDSSTTDYIAAIVTCSGGTTGVDYGTVAIVGDTWYDVVLTYSTGSGVKLYLNGVEDTGFDGSGPTGTVDATASRYHIGNTNNLLKEFQGQIESATLHNRALTPYEIQLLYKTNGNALLERMASALYKAPAAAGGTILPQIVAAYKRISA